MIIISFIFCVLLMVALIIGLMMIIFESKAIGVTDFLVRVELIFVVLMCIVCIAAAINYMIIFI